MSKQLSGVEAALDATLRVMTSWYLEAGACRASVGKVTDVAASQRISGAALSGEGAIVWSDQVDARLPALRRSSSSVAEACCKGEGSDAESSRRELASTEWAGVPVIPVGDIHDIKDSLVSFDGDPPARKFQEGQKKTL